jgi:predicted PurR-regulated permease PerM
VFDKVGFVWSYTYMFLRTRHFPNSIKYGILLLIVGTIWVFNRPFITPLLIGIIIATATYPIFAWLKKLFLKVPFVQSVAATLSACLTIILVTGILAFTLNSIARQVIRELPSFTDQIISFAKSLPQNEQIIPVLENIGVSKELVKSGVESLDSQIQNFGNEYGTDTSNARELFSQENINNAFNISRQTLTVFFNQLVYIAIFLLCWFYCLISGKKWLDSIFNVLPFRPDERKNIEKDFRDGVRNVMYANFLSGFIHTLLCFGVMWFFGIPNIFILSVVIFLIGVLPLSPSELAYAIPILLIFPLNPVFAVSFAIVGELVILWTNYILIPRIIASGEEGNPLLVLTSILSGISLFGIMGFIIGPLMIIFLQTLYRILMKRIHLERESDRSLEVIQ